MDFTKTFAETGSSLFLKLEDGETVKGVFRGAVSESYIKWEDGKSVPTTEKDPEASFRFKINFVTNENGQLTSKLWEGGKRVYKKLATLHKEYDLENTVVMLTRNGTGKTTSYEIMPAKDWKVDPVMAGKLLDVRLHSTTGKPGDDDLPF